MSGSSSHIIPEGISYFVLGGTNYDAALGITHLNQYGITAIPIGISKNPVEQTCLQTNNKKKLLDLLLEKLDHVNGATIIVYCNSLSFSFNWKKISDLTNCTFHTLTNVYDSIARQYKKISLISGNNYMLANASSYLSKLNPKISILGFSYLPIIGKIENNDCTVPNILKSTIDISAVSGVEAIIMGCTHFEDIVLENNSQLEIIYPGKLLLKKLFSDRKT